jgi:predicted HAD superfamily Cof-like phosphohydrolase
MQTKHYRAKAVAICEAMAELHQTYDVIAQNHACADCFFLLFGSAAADGMSYQDICNAIQEKFEINKRRRWGKPDENGIVKHIKDKEDDTTT